MVTDPLIDLGTHNTAAADMIDICMRNNGNPINHAHSTRAALDDQWHHVAWTHDNGPAKLYIDGVLDYTNNFTLGTTPYDTTAIAATVRATVQYYFTGLMDDVAVWKRALSQDEITKLFNEGTPRAQAVAQPLAIRSFTADFPAVAKGDLITLHWDVSKDASKVEIDQGVGDVTAQTTVGIGSISVPLNVSRTFILTVRRGTESRSSPVSVSAIDDVASGWTLLDNFDRYAVGSVQNGGYWGDVGTATMVTNASPPSCLVTPAGTQQFFRARQ